MATKFQDILVTRSGQVLTITMNRPQVLNAFRAATLSELVEAFKAAGADPEVRVIVLTGAGDRAFCAGGDINWEAEDGLRNDGRAETAPQMVARVYQAMRETYKPTVARLNGYAIGAGNHMAYMCDFTIAAEDAILGQNGPRVGSPADAWMVSYLTRVIGHKRAREMWMLCRRYTARQALEWGLVNAVVPRAELDEEVARWCADLLAASPTCLMVLKASFDDEWLSLRNQPRDYVADLNPEFWTSEQQEGSRAFLQKRKPDWTKYPVVALPNRQVEKSTA